MLQQIKLLRFVVFENRASRLFILISVFVIFNLAFVLLRHRIDYVINLYYGIPLILATYYYGFTVGVVCLFTEVLLHLLILSYLGENFTFIYQNNRIRIAFISLIVVGYIVSLFRKVKNDLKISEERYHALSDELRKTNLAKDKFFSIIAHDLRGPIGAINSNIDLIINSKDDLTDQEKNKLMLALHAMSTRVFSLLENLLKWAMMQRGNMHFDFKRIDVKPMCDECLMLFQYLAIEKQITLENRVPDELSVWADKTALESVVRNLISNALKFTYPKGKVVVLGSREDNRVQLMIRDNGIGIQKTVLNKLFDIEHEISSEGTSGEKGTGLGLVLSHELIRQCNGTLTVESQPGQGSVFTIELPVGDHSHLSDRN
jgi:signal transduction histidine kinase